MLTPEQRAKRRTTKINNRISKELPLFAGTDVIAQFQTTHEKQIIRVRQWDEINERYFQKLDEREKETFQRAHQYRAKLAGLVSPSVLIELDKILEGKQSRWALFYRPEYMADYWFTEIRKLEKEPA